MGAGNFGFLPLFHSSGINMLNVLRTLRSIVAHKRGATAIEYGLIAALIAVGAVGAMSGLGTQLKKTFNNSSTTMSKG
jgi:pilus assembly protein Flp/PilA